MQTFNRKVIVKKNEVKSLKEDKRKNSKSNKLMILLYEMKTIPSFKSSENLYICYVVKFLTNIFISPKFLNIENLKQLSQCVLCFYVVNHLHFPIISFSSEKKLTLHKINNYASCQSNL